MGAIKHPDSWASIKVKIVIRKLLDVHCQRGVNMVISFYSFLN